MKTLLLCVDIPNQNGYFGGVVFIVDKYLKNELLFSNAGYHVELHNFADSHSKLGILKGKIGNIIYIFKQAKDLKKRIRKNPDVDVHIHTSRKWTLLKDLFIIGNINKIIRGKIYLTIHFADIEKILYKNAFLKKFSIKTMNTKIEKVIFLSKRTSSEFIEAGLNPAKAKILYTFHNFPQMDGHPANDGKLHLLFMGSIDKRKGILDLLSVMDSSVCDNVTLSICGKITDDSIRDQFEQYCSRLESVHFLGYLEGAEKEKAFLDADIFILPSYGEGMPIVIMEAMAASCAIVATSVGAVPEIIQNGVNGYLYTPGDNDALKNILDQLQKNPDELQKMQFTNSLYSKEFSLEENIKKLIDIYDGK